MRRLVTLLFAGAFVAGLAGWCSFGSAAEKEGDKSTIQGELIDTYCYAAGDAQGEAHKGCGQKCASSGIPVGVLADGKAWTLATNPAPLAQYMADQVRVTGTLNKEAGILAPDKVEVKQGDQWKEVKLSDAHHSGGEESDSR